MTASMPLPKESLAYANGIELAYQDIGRRTAPVVLLIMGLGSPMIVWDDEFCLSLAARGLRVIRFDNRDCGRSTSMDAGGVPDIARMLSANACGLPVTAPYRIADMADDATGLLDALSIESAHVVGASMGGMIAQEMALRHPARVRTLTSIMSSTGNPELPPGRPQAMGVLMMPTPRDWPAYLARHLKIWSVLCGDTYPLDTPRAEDMARRLFERGPNAAGTARQLAAIIASGNRKPALAHVRVPALVLHGRDDPLVLLEAGIDTADAIPGAKLRVFDGMGHALPMAMWPDIVESIAEHIASRDASPA
ncbi:alpha/beta hydrolase [Variovorax sp. J22R133]|uniref:alpha/beta fold hydrolase n=1 Tax=Variovorax brevis TaxID=3053503 RepID=UPI0025775E4D|nr:alpha/beta hydrolase [Variovorax sp. J22R133]MDM0112970.1 alpha/beta hydrolase [Variovorax sp. J22R133]